MSETAVNSVFSNLGEAVFSLRSDASALHARTGFFNALDRFTRSDRVRSPSSLANVLFFRQPRTLHSALLDHRALIESSGASVHLDREIIISSRMAPVRFVGILSPCVDISGRPGHFGVGVLVESDADERTRSAARARAGALHVEIETRRAAGETLESILADPPELVDHIEMKRADEDRRMRALDDRIREEREVRRAAEKLRDEREDRRDATDAPVDPFAQAPQIDRGADLGVSLDAAPSP